MTYEEILGFIERGIKSTHIMVVHMKDGTKLYGFLENHIKSKPTGHNEWYFVAFGHDRTPKSTVVLNGDNIENIKIEAK
ncbi:MAG: hypothetical protein CVU05_03230 [Bacteroidetes bacterium HGW-Bacteroidetes-21]|jgi:hypothetical protein|nr:MAG: hypothetical protein CVU05_03230 [Bacteroidetes bacterium HGW-Bacteroidetes-21]